MKLRPRAVLPTPAALGPCLMLGAALATAGATVAPAPDGLDFAGVHIGMTQNAWKAAPFPGAPSSRVEPVCSDDAAATAGLVAATASARRAGVVICAYMSHYGRFRLPQAIDLGPGLQARRLRFTFVKGRLSSIEYRASADAFNELTTRLTGRYGPPRNLIRDAVKTELGAFPRVRQTWRTPRGEIDLVDPVQPFTELSVRLTGAPPPAGRAS